MSARRGIYLLFIFIILIISCKSKQEYIGKEIIPYPHVISPNGEQLSFVTMTFFEKNNNLPRYRLLLLSLHNDETMTSIKQPIIWGPIWSKDNKHLFFSCPYEHSPAISLFTYNINEKSITPVLPYDDKLKYYSDLYPSISRTGEILFLRFSSTKVNDSQLYESELWVIDINKNFKYLASGLIGKAMWTYDNKICLIKINWINKESSFCIVDPVTAQEVKLLPSVANFEIFDEKNAALIFRKLDNSRLNISILDLSTLKEQKIKDTLNFNYPSIAPSSKQMCFIRDNEVWILDLATLKEKQLTSTKSQKNYPIWTKDSLKIIYKDENRALWMISIDGAFHNKIWG